METIMGSIRCFPLKNTFLCYCLWIERCQRVDDIDDKDVGGQDDEVHHETYAHKVAEAVATRTIYQHVGGRADGRGKAAAHADHQGNQEGIWLVS